MQSVDQDKNIHENHRNRLRERFEKSPETLSKHELLEVLLFNAIPRANVNPLAHRLLHKFGSLTGVVHATPEELKTVEGVGNATAVYLSSIGKITDAILSEKFTAQKFYNFETAKEYLMKYYAGQNVETFTLIMLDDNDRIISKEGFSQGNARNASVPFSEFSARLANKKVASIVVAHNHPSGNFNPSQEDDLTTEQLFLYCNMIKVKLYDHIIVSDEGAFSYFASGRLEEIGKRFETIGI